MPEILAFAGSGRPASPNRRLVEVAAAGAREGGASVTVVDLASFPLPLCDFDGLTPGAEPLPEAAQRLAALTRAAGGLLIASPEVNGVAAPLLLNTLGWLGAAGSLKGKACGVVGAAAAEGGGVRGLAVLGNALAALGAVIVPTPVAVLGGDLSDPRLENRVKDVGRGLAAFLVRRPS